MNQTILNSATCNSDEAVLVVVVVAANSKIVAPCKRRNQGKVLRLELGLAARLGPVRSRQVRLGARNHPPRAAALTGRGLAND